VDDLRVWVERVLIYLLMLRIPGASSHTQPLSSPRQSRYHVDLHPYARSARTLQKHVASCLFGSFAANPYLGVEDVVSPYTNCRGWVFTHRLRLTRHVTARV
jgi:hypothetical protein